MWHRRYGHLGYTNLARLVRGNMVSGLDIDTKDFEIAAGKVCEPCVITKQTRATHQASDSTSERPLELVHCDVCGPVGTESVGGCKYVLTLTDDYSKLSVIQPLRSKRDVSNEIISRIKYLRTVSQEQLLARRTDLMRGKTSPL